MSLKATVRRTDPATSILQLRPSRVAAGVCPLISTNPSAATESKRRSAFPWRPVGNIAAGCLVDLFRCEQHHGLGSGGSGRRSSQAQRCSRHFIGDLADYVKIGSSESVVADLNVTPNALDHRSNGVAARGSSFAKEALCAGCGVTDLPEIPGHRPSLSPDQTVKPHRAPRGSQAPRLVRRAARRATTALQDYGPHPLSPENRNETLALHG